MLDTPLELPPGIDTNSPSLVKATRSPGGSFSFTRAAPLESPLWTRAALAADDAVYVADDGLFSAYIWKAPRATLSQAETIALTAALQAGEHAPCLAVARPWALHVTVLDAGSEGSPFKALFVDWPPAVTALVSALADPDAHLAVAAMFLPRATKKAIA